ncbi:hypothetical protein Btru_070478 [Bulinus truncatus]|nr:hypothetical protein Btru_070478 [Bulinus truncatus]
MTGNSDKNISRARWWSNFARGNIVPVREATILGKKYRFRRCKAVLRLTPLSEIQHGIFFSGIAWSERQTSRQSAAHDVFHPPILAKTNISECLDQLELKEEEDKTNVTMMDRRGEKQMKKKYGIENNSFRWNMDTEKHRMKSRFFNKGTKL